MIRTKLLTTGLLIFALSAHAQDDSSKRAKIKELFTLMHLQDRMEITRAAALQHAQEFANQELATLALSKSQEDVSRRYRDKVNLVVLQIADWQKMEPRYEQVYAEVYTEDEIDGAVAFYKSPAGQAWLAKASKVTTGLADVTEEQLQSTEPQIRQLTKEFKAQIEAAKPQR